MPYHNDIIHLVLQLRLTQINDKCVVRVVLMYCYQLVVAVTVGMSLLIAFHSNNHKKARFSQARRQGELQALEQL